MRIRRKLPLIALLLALLLLFAGCASQAAPAGSAVGEEIAPVASAAAEAPAQDSATSSSSGASFGPAEGGWTGLDIGNAAASGRKIIYNAEMAIEATDARAASEAILSLVEGCGGYVSNSSFSGNDVKHSATVTARVPPEKLKDFSAQVGKLGRVLDSSLNSQDITADYVDIQARLTNAQAQETQLLKVLEQATKIEDILKVREQLNGIESDIESYKGQLRLMNNQVGYSTVAITVFEPEPPSVNADDNSRPVQFWGFRAIGQKVVLALKSSVNWTANAVGILLMVLGYLSVPLAIAAVIVVVVLLLVRWRRRKKAAPRE